MGLEEFGLRKRVATTEFDFHKNERLQAHYDAIRERRRGVVDRAKGAPAVQRAVANFDATVLNPLAARANALRNARVPADLAVPGVPISLAISHLEALESLVETAEREIEKIEEMLPNENATVAVLTSAAQPHHQRIFSVNGRGVLIIRKAV
jgi:hypothetical protein